MSNPKPESKVQIRDLLQVEWSGEQWEKLVALLDRKAQSLEQASNQTNSPEPDGAINNALQDLDIEGRMFQVELSRSVNKFKEAPNGQAHLQRLTDITGRSTSNSDLLNRKELTRSLEEALGAAERGRVGDPRAGGARAGYAKFLA